MVDSIYASHLRCTVLDLDKLAGPRGDGSTLQELSNTVLFSRQASDLSGLAPQIRVPMAALKADGHEQAVGELWQLGGDVTQGAAHGVRYSHNDEVLFGAIQLAEAEFDTLAGCDEGKTPLQQASEAAYQRIFQLLDALDFPHILRFWNYLADINGYSHDVERYQQFNIGRQDGFMRSGRDVMGGVPAASAVGFREGPLTVYFFAARNVRPLAIENPRQISAYEYPQEYGPRSPTFSRASIAHWGSDKPNDSHLLFVSGTASIVGHQSLHVGDVIAQTRESLANIAAILQEAKRVQPAANFSLGDLCYKVYVRHAQDVAAIRNEIQRIAGVTTHVLFLHADICRHDLLVEIEASAGYPMQWDLPC